MSNIINTSNDVLRARSKQITVSDSIDARTNQAGGEFNIATDSKVITLPKITNENIGAEFTFRNTGADGNNIITISPNAADAVNGTVAAVQAGGVLNKDWINTKSSATTGDWCRLKAVELTGWYITGGDGVWASES